MSTNWFTLTTKRSLGDGGAGLDVGQHVQVQTQTQSDNSGKTPVKRIKRTHSAKQLIVGKCGTTKKK